MWFLKYYLLLSCFNWRLLVKKKGHMLWNRVFWKCLNCVLLIILLIVLWQLVPTQLWAHNAPQTNQWGLCHQHCSENSHHFVKTWCPSLVARDSRHHWRLGWAHRFARGCLTAQQPDPDGQCWGSPAVSIFIQSPSRDPARWLYSMLASSKKKMFKSCCREQHFNQLVRLWKMRFTFLVNFMR